MAVQQTCMTDCRAASEGATQFKDGRDARACCYTTRTTEISALCITPRCSTLRRVGPVSRCHVSSPAASGIKAAADAPVSVAADAFAAEPCRSRTNKNG